MWLWQQWLGGSKKKKKSIPTYNITKTKKKKKKKKIAMPLQPPAKRPQSSNSCSYVPFPAKYTSNFGILGLF
jgi:hypothetical protein